MPVMLTTEDEAKKDIVQDVDSGRLERLIKAVSEDIQAYCGRKFEQQEHTDVFKSVNQNRLILSEYPVKSIEYVKIDDEEIEDYEADKESGILKRDKGWNGEVEVKYTAGYKLPGETDRDLPYNLEDACIAWVAFRVNTSNALGLHSYQAEQMRVQFKDIESMAPRHVLALLRMHKDERV